MAIPIVSSSRYVLRTLQASTALGLLGLATFNVVVMETYPAIWLSLLLSVWQLAGTVYLLVAAHSLPFLYSRLGTIVLDAVTVTLAIVACIGTSLLLGGKTGAALLYVQGTIATIPLILALLLLHCLTLGLSAHNWATERHSPRGGKGKRSLSQHV